MSLVRDVHNDGSNVNVTTELNGLQFFSFIFFQKSFSSITRCSVIADTDKSMDSTRRNKNQKELSGQEG